MFGVLLSSSMLFSLLQTLFLFNLVGCILATPCPTSFADAVRGGLWDCARTLGNELQSKGTDPRNILDLESRLINKEIALLKKHLEGNIPLSVINPAYQWAQSADEVLLNVKFAHKLDTPATLNVEAKNVNITSNLFELTASNGRKMFTLNLKFLRDVIPEESSWSMASVGRMTFTFKKKHPQWRWTRLLLDSSKKTPNQHFWWEMNERHSDILDKLKEDDGSRTPEELTPTVAKPQETESGAVNEKNDTDPAPASINMNHGSLL